MSLDDLSSRTAVEKAIEEFDRLGRAQFLKKYGFGEARDYYLEFDGKLYDSKAIAGVAYGYQFPDRGYLRASSFSGGAETVQPKLEQLGFSVRVTQEQGNSTPGS